MEVFRASFFELKPEKVETLSFDPSGRWLAVGRAGGVVQIWEVSHQGKQWCFSMGGHAEECPRAFIWKKKAHNDTSSSNGPELSSYRLFSSGTHGLITEWDLQRGVEKGTYPTQGGACWDMCETEDGFAIGCDDGCVRLFEVNEEVDEDGDATGKDPVVFKKSFNTGKGKCKVMTVCRVDDKIYAGTTDSTISKWNIKTGTCEDRMTTESAGKKHTTVVWSLCDIGGGFLVSGDSTGAVLLWDTNTMTLVNKFADHQADVLKVIKAGKTRFASAGVDGKISIYSCKKINEQGAAAVAFQNSILSHQNDVAALASTGENMVSGGTDGQLHFHKLSVVERSEMRKNAKKAKSQWTYYERVGPYGGVDRRVDHASAARVVVCQHSYRADVWYLQPPSKKSKTPNQPSPVKMWSLKLKGGQRCILSSALAPGGDLVALSDSAGTRLFKLDLATLECKKRSCKQISKIASVALRFIGPTRLALCDRTNNEVIIHDIADDRIVHRFDKFEEPLRMLACSPNGEWLAVCTLTKCMIYNLDSMTLHCTLPRFSGGAIISAVSFDNKSARLFVTSTHNQWQGINLETQKILPGAGSIPVLDQLQRVTGIEPCSGDIDKIMFWGQDFVATLDLDTVKETSQQTGNAKKRKTNSGSVNTGPTDTHPAWKKQAFDHCIGVNLLTLSDYQEAAKSASKQETLCLISELSQPQVKKMLPEQFQRKVHNKV